MAEESVRAVLATGVELNQRARTRPGKVKNKIQLVDVHAMKSREPMPSIPQIAGSQNHTAPSSIKILTPVSVQSVEPLSDLGPNKLWTRSRRLEPFSSNVETCIWTLAQIKI